MQTVFAWTHHRESWFLCAGLYPPSFQIHIVQWHPGDAAPLLLSSHFYQVPSQLHLNPTEEK